MSAAAKLDPKRYEPPDDATVNQAIADYAQVVRDAYGERVRAIYLFGSRARGDHAPQSDADIAVVLEDEVWDFWGELFRLSDLGYELLIDLGANVHAYPLPASAWVLPEIHANPSLLHAIRRDGRFLAEAA